MSGSAAAAFAWTGDPTAVGSSGKILDEWPRACSQEGLKSSSSSPHQFKLLVAGGPYGTGPVTVGQGGVAAQDETATDRAEAMAWAKILGRCKFINSIAEEIDV